ncbi:unnamed protein product [Orchesella dallaii]|uniref:Glucose-methanol-choline oxidoreductase N-terminal domain-containing protein n=1 Tax=Orchesella dallaii TaxID=48710 RepID=A0ABP1QHV8_9HEXA
MYTNMATTNVPSLLTPAFTSYANIVPSITSVLSSALPIMVISFGFWDQYSDFLHSQTLENYQKNVVEEYDFIIVGGGSAGCVLSNKLSANPNYKILLLESGGNPNPMQAVPIYFSLLLHTPQIDYDFYTVPQKDACLALKERRSFWPRGMGLGGSSNLNAMFFQRGNRHDYDKWAELSGSNEWKFDNILRNFKNIEDYHGMYYNEKWRSKNGRGVYVSTVQHTNLLDEFFQAGRELGYPIRDVNGDQKSSFSRLEVAIKDGRRFGAYQAFLEPVLNRTNLHIYRYARVTKIHLTKKTKRAYGVTYKRHGVEHFVRAKREIIVSAGAIDSPKLLMLSGIGPKVHLETQGIKCLIDLPVGKNLHDHIMVMFGPFTVDTPGKAIPLGIHSGLNTVTDYFTQHKGVMASPTGANAIAYIHSSISKQRENITNTSPDLQILFGPGSLNVADMFEKFGSVNSGVLKKYFGGIEKDKLYINVMLGKQRSRGEIRLASADPFVKPILDPKYLSHPDDIKILVDGLNFTVNMAENTEAFRKIGTRLIDRHFPGCEGFKLKSEEYYECYARHMTWTDYHPCGTCAMGKGPEDPKAVVDSKLRVLHAKGLRVVDASIIPEIPNSNLNAAVFMLADRASEFILDYWAQVDNSFRRRRIVREFTRFSRQG